MIFLNWEELTQDKLKKQRKIFNVCVYIINCYIIVKEKLGKNRLYFERLQIDQNY